MAGQTDVIEHIAMPSTHGFHKRFNLAFMPEKSLLVDVPLVETSKNLLSGAHSWMFHHCMEETGCHFLDGYALTIYNDVKTAVEDWHTSEEGANAMHNQNFSCEKLLCWSTDILRLAHANMRICQFLAATWSRSTQHAKRTEPNATEFLLALHMWIRQFHIHSCFYRWSTKVRNVKEGSEHRLAPVMEREDEEEDLSFSKSQLSASDRLKHEILVLQAFGPGMLLASDSTRDCLRNKRFFHVHKIKSSDILTAYKDMISSGLVMNKDADGHSRKKGKKATIYCKVPFEQIQRQPSAKAELVRLGVDIKFF